MIILNPKKSNTIFKKFLFKYTNNYNIPYLECPFCNSSDFISWGYYERNINYIDNNQIVFDVIKIKRVKCKKCGHTHALLPAGLTPYKASTINLILSAISNDSLTVHFSFDTIFTWRKLFNKFLPYLKTLFPNSSKSQIINTLKTNLFNSIIRFYDSTKKILLMSHKGILNMAYFLS